MIITERPETGVKGADPPCVGKKGPGEVRGAEPSTGEKGGEGVCRRVGEGGLQQKKSGGTEMRWRRTTTHLQKKTFFQQECGGSGKIQIEEEGHARIAAGRNYRLTGGEEKNAVGKQ